MRIKNAVMLFVVAGTALMLASCGGSSSGDAAGGGGGGGGGGVATVDTLASLPTMDLSSYDSSTSSSANLAVLVPQTSSIKRMGEGIRDIGKSSRAGCEANMHKKEIFRMSQQTQLDRCYPEAMEKAGLLTIPTGSYAYYLVQPPEMSREEAGKMCEGIPPERERERAACESENAEGASKTILMKIGKGMGVAGNELHVDMCRASGGSAVLENEGTYYTPTRSQIVADVVRKGSWGGGDEGGSFHVLVDLETSGSVADGVATLGADGLVNASGRMAGNFGRGTIAFEKIASDSSNKVYGSFAGSFEDPFTQTISVFTGKTYSRFGGASQTGCAQFEFTGSMPAMPVSNMIPFNVPAAEQDAFLQQFAAQLGLSSLAWTDKLCPNPNFNPEDAAETDMPMTLLGTEETTCPPVTNTGLECFGIVNGTTTGNFGESIVTQTFTIVADSDYRAEVAAFRLTDLAAPPASADEILFTRNWDCSGTFTTIDFAAASRDVLEAAISECKAIEDRARSNDGMGGYNCGEQEQMNGVQEIADNGGGTAAFGNYGGELTEPVNSTCPADVPPKLFINTVNPASSEYCLALDGSCSPFTVDGNVATMTIRIGNSNAGDINITRIAYSGGDTPTNATLTFTVNSDSCTADYSINRFDDFHGGGAEFGGEGAYIPQPCIDRGLTRPEDASACGQLCVDLRDACAPPSS